MRQTRSDRLLHTWGKLAIVGVAPLDWGADLARVSEVQGRLDPLSTKLRERVGVLRGQKQGDEPSTAHRQPSEVVEDLRIGTLHDKAHFPTWPTFCVVRPRASQPSPCSS